MPEIPNNPLAHGNDEPPLMSKVPEPAPSHWGKLTSKRRVDSVSYLLFAAGVKRKEAQKKWTSKTSETD